MERTRVAALTALLVALSVGGAAAMAAVTEPVPALAPVTWPPSTLLVSEVQTGGASASDEFAEITNAGATAVDLLGLEIVYATSSGSTVTRKATWSTSLLLEPGRHLLIANSTGAFAPIADATYSGGFAATGGAIVLRVVGGAPVDAVGWGDATNTFVEGTAIAAPPAGSSVERAPGGMGGNTVDTNDNAANWFTQASPSPQSLAAPPVPVPGATLTPPPTVAPSVVPSSGPTVGPTTSPSPIPSATPGPTVTPTTPPEPTPAATVEPSPMPMPSSSVAPTEPATPPPAATPSPTPALTPAPTPEPTPTGVPTLAPTPVPTPAPTSDPTPALTPSPTVEPTPTPLPAVSIATARGQADGTAVRISGVLTTQLGRLEDGRKAFVHDDTGGIAIYLDAEVPHGLPAGTAVTITGTVDDRFAERTLRASVGDVIASGTLPLPPPSSHGTGTIGEAVEGTRVLVQGVTVGSSTDLADGVGLMVDDGSGPVRVIVGAPAGGFPVPSGTLVVAIGPVGQRDSSGTGLAGYRIHATESGEFTILPPPETPPPSPTPSPSPSPSPTATPAPTPAPMPTPRPSATPAPTAAPSPTPTATRTPSPTATVRPTATPGPTPPPVISIVEARGAPIGTVVTLSGVVTAEAGRLGSPALVAIADGSGGIVVRLREGAAPPARGTTVQVKGALADPYGQLELRASNGGFATTGQGSLPAPVRLAGADLGERTEGRLAEMTGTMASAPSKGADGDLSVYVLDAAGTRFRLVIDGSSGIGASDLVKGRTYRLTGIVGQRASRKGAADGYRLHLRDRGDIVAVADPGGPGPSGAPATVVPIATALALPEGTTATVEGTVTAGTSLLDSSGRRIVLQDATAAIEILLPSGSRGPAVGAKLRITGTVGRAWGAPRMGASSVESRPGASPTSPKSLTRPPAERDEWLLVRISGTVIKVERLGDRWRAEILLAGGAKAPVLGQAGAGIPSTAIVSGRRITVTGIVKRPYPTASDRRFAVLPRNRGDVSIGPSADGRDGGTGSGSIGGGSFGASGSGSGSGTGAGSASVGATAGALVDVTPDTDLAALSDRVGERVRVGGLIARLATDGFDLDDGTALARVRLVGGIAALLPHLRNGEAVAATGTVELVDGAHVVVVDDEGTLVRVGSLGQAMPIAGVGSGATPTASPAIGAAPMTAEAGGVGSNFAPTSLLALAGLTLASIAATTLRRRLVQRRLREALVERLASLRPSPAPKGPNVG